MSSPESIVPMYKRPLIRATAAVALVASLAAAEYFAANELSDDAQQAASSDTKNSTPEAIDLQSSAAAKKSKADAADKEIKPKDFSAEPISCEPALEIPNLEIKLPISWIGSYISTKKVNDGYRTAPDEFTANLTGEASILQCLGDVSAVQYDADASESTGITTFSVESGSLNYVVDTSKLDATITTYARPVIVDMLQAENPNATVEDARALEDRIEATQHNACQIVDYYFGKELIDKRQNIFDLGAGRAQVALLEQAEAQGIEPDAITFEIEAGKLYEPTICSGQYKRPKIYPDRYRIFTKKIDIDGQLQLTQEETTP